MQLIDIHTHIYPDEIAQKATDSIKSFYQLGGGGMDGTEKMLREKGKEAGISRFVILPVAIRPDRVMGINDFIRSRTAGKPEYVGFGTIHAGMEAPAEEAERLLFMGLRGIKMHPDSQRFAIDDLRLLPMYDAIQGKLPVMLHMGDQRYDYSHPVKLRRILDLFPKLQVIAAHFGGYGMYETAYDLLKDKDCIFDVSSSLMFMEDGVAERYIRAYGAERMAFGTDYPLWNPVTETERFFRLRLTDEEFDQIGHKTAERFLKL
jgi:predicted TIM-barrel fold metal-dependent hydrolase